MKINHLAVVSLPVKDVEAARQFYTETLGFVVRRDDPFMETRWIEVAPEGAQTTIALVSWFPNMPPGSGDGLVLNTDDVHAVYESLKGRGVEMTDIETAPWGTFFSLKDPDGNNWIVQQDAPTPTA